MSEPFPIAYAADCPPRRRLLLERILRDHPDLGTSLDLSANPTPDVLCSTLLRQCCDPGKRTIALAYHPHIWSQLGADFADQLRQAGYNCLCVSFEQGYDVQEAFYPVDQALMERLVWIDLCMGSTMPYWLTWAGGPLANMKTLNIERTARSVLRAGWPCQWLYMMTNGSHLVMPLEKALADQSGAIRLELPESLRIPGDAIGPRRTSWILPLLPSKFERIENLRASLPPAAIDRILVCPAHSNLAGNWIQSHGRLVLQALLDRFPEHTVVFRPRPEDRTRPDVVELVAALRHNGHFLFDDQDDYAPNYARGVLLITDRSSTGQTFTMATLRPSIYLLFDSTVIPHRFQELDGVGCFNAGSLAGLLELAVRFVEQPFEQGPQIEEIRRQYYAANPSSGQSMMNYLDCVVQDRTHPDWAQIVLHPENVIGTTTPDYETSVHTLLALVANNQSRNYSFLALTFLCHLIPRYLAKKKDARERIPDTSLAELLPWIVFWHEKGHGDFIVQPALDLLLHNLRISPEASEGTAAFAREFISTVLVRNHPESVALLEQAFPDLFSEMVCFSSSQQNLMGRLVELRLMHLVQAGVRNVALYGAGKHTHWLRSHVRVPWGMNITGVLDDHPSAGQPFTPLVVQRPQEVSPDNLDAIMLSTDQWQDAFKSRIEAAWGNKAPRVVDLYEGLPPGPYPKDKRGQLPPTILRACARELVTLYLQVKRSSPLEGV